MHRPKSTRNESLLRIQINRAPHVAKEHTLPMTGAEHLGHRRRRAPSPSSTRLEPSRRPKYQ